MSSVWIVPFAVAVPNEAPVGADRVTMKVSLFSMSVSPTTLSVIVFDVSPTAKLSVPLGNAAAPKSAALAPPVGADTANFTVAGVIVAPPRITVNVNGVRPLFPSAWLACNAAIASPESSF